MRGLEGLGDLRHELGAERIGTLDHEFVGGGERAGEKRAGDEKRKGLFHGMNVAMEGALRI